MQLGMIGLGRMGANMVRRLMAAGHQCAVYDTDPDQVAALAAEGAVGAASTGALVEALDAPRSVWIMIPADRVDASLSALADGLEPDDLIVDGGNSHYRDAVRRAKALSAKGLRYMDVGTSGGVRGLERGYCLMVGGDAADFQRLEPVFASLAPGRDAAPSLAARSGRSGTAEHGYLHCGSHGAGHFVKMIHNGIEYGAMAAYAEGLQLLDSAGAASGYRLELADITELWRRGSVIGSWLLDLTADELARDPTLAGFSDKVADSGEGRWTVQAAVDAGVPAHVLTAALYARFGSRDNDTFARRVLSAMRFAFGGHREHGD
ncbi:MAG: decarboxylating 6-phosphogluconate dehydrogenase [Gammaproteobacteria bacterium]|nr:decarboxylating 6-phosphogluconate dehydrogenase [Gammaproteobacteria bacterium]NIR24677.1 decarboxylating 6-phosphogluconate dehydrogenase [Gammaproteobacteria bacterium]NIS06291.1 decarboxylating 6-phosphogluconate dehydrogenase [Gammaproteobacteria bacterium]NIU42117.1 decarboxylating 6-phosphogluconate dehydrogenase [Gammaproteobacteria bacterium]NIV49047.1 decarboxylating 6-phosphogluconate dehydrogenase [Gammaproteobacteria bacterium]